MLKLYTPSNLHCIYPTDVELSLSLPQFPYALAAAHGVPRHTAWESQHNSFKSQQLYKLINILIVSNKINYKNVFKGLKITLFITGGTSFSFEQ